MTGPPRAHADRAGRAAAADRLEVQILGEGPRVVFVHGSVLGARHTWREQLPLARRWTLVLAQRPGFGRSPALARGDFEAEAPLFADLLGPGAHLVGHSYGAVIALYAAALRPDAVLSLTVSEPGCLRVAGDDPRVAEQIASGELLYDAADTLSPLAFLSAFRGGVGSTHDTPAELEGELMAGARLLSRERPPWEARPAWRALRETAYPKLVVSGAHSPVFEAVCDAVARELAAERAAVPGRRHTIPANGRGYNELLARFMGQAERASGDGRRPPARG